VESMLFWRWWRESGGAIWLAQERSGMGGGASFFSWEMIRGSAARLAPRAAVRRDSGKGIAWLQVQPYPYVFRVVILIFSLAADVHWFSLSVKSPHESSSSLTNARRRRSAGGFARPLSTSAM
jgi:hypothetical protein